MLVVFPGKKPVYFVGKFLKEKNPVKDSMKRITLGGLGRFMVRKMCFWLIVKAVKCYWNLASPRKQEGEVVFSLAMHFGHIIFKCQ